MFFPPPLPRPPLCDLLVYWATESQCKCMPHLRIQVYIDGVLELTGESSSALVRVYSADADTRTLGSVFYRETTSPELLEVSSALFGASFMPTNFTSMFIATWFYVGYYDGGVDLVCVLCVCGVCVYCVWCSVCLHAKKPS